MQKECKKQISSCHCILNCRKEPTQAKLTFNLKSTIENPASDANFSEELLCSHEK